MTSPPPSVQLLGEFPIINETLSKDFGDSRKPPVYEVHMRVQIDDAAYASLAQFLQSDRRRAWGVLASFLVGNTPAHGRARNWIHALFV